MDLARALKACCVGMGLVGGSTAARADVIVPVGPGASAPLHHLSLRKRHHGLTSHAPAHVSSQYISPEVAPGQKKTGPTKPVPTGPLAPIGKAAEDAGLALHLFYFDPFFSNLSVGTDPGRIQNTGVVVAGVDFDLNHILGIRGATFHAVETLYPYHVGDNTFGAVSDLTPAWELFYTPHPDYLSIFTYEQKLADDRLDIEVGRSNMMRSFDLPFCASWVSCYSNLMYQDVNAKVIGFGSLSGRAAYNITPAMFVQGGVYEDNPKVSSQYEFQDAFGHSGTGVNLIGELGYKTDFPVDLYPQRYELIGVYNTSPANDPYLNAAGRAITTGTAPTLVHDEGTAVFLAQAQKVVWRADHGADADNHHPTALVLDGSAGFSPMGYARVSAEAYGGLTLQAPLPSRPFDTIGVKIHWTQLSNSEQAYLQSANLAAGNTGYFKDRNSIGYELNAHVQLAQYVSIDPTIQYFANANNYYAPTSAQARDGWFFGGALSVSAGQLLGLSSAP